MRYQNHYMKGFKRLLIFTAILISPATGMAQSDNDQKIGFGLHFDPVIGWFRSDYKGTMNEGARPGFNFGLTFNRYFSPNYSFSTGISLINAGGRLSSNETTIMKFNSFNSIVLPGDPVIYKIQYLSVPAGLKLQTNQIGYITFFTDLGLDPKVVIGGKADIPSLDISGEDANDELRLFNIGYHITAGIEYSVGGTTAFVLGLNFENNFLDITKETGAQSVDKVTHKMLAFRLGINF